ncbi:unnamed protein product, partial [Mesorhabditis belari]|uniref:Uncharacterized protein n=1 Tax=Mesorhabditis belari TaxID=2138241 RepID=A0AAF3F9N9_9BILA
MIWLIYVHFCFGISMYTCIYLFKTYPEKDILIDRDMKNVLNISLDDRAYVGPLYWVEKEAGSVFQWDEVMADYRRAFLKTFCKLVTRKRIDLDHSQIIRGKPRQLSSIRAFYKHDK